MLQHHKQQVALLLSLALLLPLLSVAGLTGAARAQVRSQYDMGAAGLGQSLRRLQTIASAMHTGAHPDDEDTALIARLARGDSARVAYLSLNRGEGGQNIIGPELFEPLGVIRTEELLQSRRLDGGEQFFTRAMDYGFSKTRAEAAAKWGERLVLGDMVRAIRLFRPLVVISRFSGTPADGHGQHQLAGYLTPQAFRAAADPKEFPEQLAEGLRPWRALKLYVGQGFRENAANPPTVRLDTGEYDPLIGRSYFEVAMEGRSQHKSQEMGLLELRGPQSSGLRLVESASKTEGMERSVFDGIDTSIRGIAKLSGLTEEIIGDELGDTQKAATRALAEYDALAPQKIIEPLADGLRAARKARAKLASARISEQARADADFMLARKEREFEESLRRAAGVEVDALASTETIAPGESLSVAVRAFVPAGAPVKVGEMRLRAPTGWTSETAPEPAPASTGFRPTRETAAKAVYFTLAVPRDAQPTQPYWLNAPREGYLFRWADNVPKNEPFGEPPLLAEADVEIGGARVLIVKPVQYRYADDIRGELRRVPSVVPALTVALDSDLIIAPIASLPRETRVAVRVTNHSRSPVEGDARLRLPAGWTARPAAAPFKLSKKGERTAVVFQVTVPRATKPGAYQLAAQASTGSGASFEQDMRVIAYPHIQTHRLYAPAVAAVRVFDFKVAPVRVGYVMGSGDQGPAAIERMGLKVTMLGEEDLSSGDLSRFDTIVVGVRASEVRPDFVANTSRLLDFVRAGGALIVQYQRPDYVDLGLAPFPAKMAARVTDETAPVRILQPQHQAFNFPNKIGPADWEGWVQERSLYNFTTFDPSYAPLIESRDEGEEAQRGGEVYAEIGRGKYVYTSYAWFRQLPSGVPGAYRLFANLISLSAKPGATHAKRAK